MRIDSKIRNIQSWNFTHTEPDHQVLTVCPRGIVRFIVNCLYYKMDKTSWANRILVFKLTVIIKVLLVHDACPRSFVDIIIFTQHEALYKNGQIFMDILQLRIWSDIHNFINISRNKADQEFKFTLREDTEFFTYCTKKSSTKTIFFRTQYKGQRV